MPKLEKGNLFMERCIDDFTEICCKCNACGRYNSNYESGLCKSCIHLQPDESSAGLREGCIADQIYLDEDCQIFSDDNLDIVTNYRLGRREDCPFYKRLNQMN